MSPFRFFLAVSFAAVLLDTMNRQAESRRWYLAARQQLRGLRVTPARRALQAQVETALLELDSG